MRLLSTGKYTVIKNGCDFGPAALLLEEASCGRSTWGWKSRPASSIECLAESRGRMDREKKSAKWTLFPGMQESGTRCRLRTEARPREMFPSIFVESKLNCNRAQRENRDLNEIFHQLVNTFKRGSDK